MLIHKLLHNVVFFFLLTPHKAFESKCFLSLLICFCLCMSMCVTFLHTASCWPRPHSEYWFHCSHHLAAVSKIQTLVCIDDITVCWLPVTWLLSIDDLLISNSLFSLLHRLALIEGFRLELPPTHTHTVFTVIIPCDCDALRPWPWKGPVHRPHPNFLPVLKYAPAVMPHPQPVSAGSSCGVQMIEKQSCHCSLTEAQFNLNLTVQL